MAEQQQKEREEDEMLSSKALQRCSSLPSRRAPLSLESPNPSSASITRPYKLSPSTGSGLFPSSTARPSALLQRRAKANQGLSSVSTPPSDHPSEPASAAEETASLAASSARARLPTAYEILRVAPSASQQEIKASFWRLARQHHPDKAPIEEREASSVTFLQIHSAYNMLKDPQSRAQYDRQLFVHSSPGFPADLKVPHSWSPSATQGQAFTPRETANSVAPRYTPSTTRSTSSLTPRTPYSSGRNWETDQCW